jgi:hypothetical protein
MLLVLGLTLSCSTILWHHIREFTDGGIRASQRFLGLAGFGLAVLTGLGADVVFRRWPKAGGPVAAGVAALFIASPLWWVHTAGNITEHEGREGSDTVRAQALRPLEVWSDERRLADKLRTEGYRELVRFHRGGREFLSGRGYSDGYEIVGNRLEAKLFRNVRWGKPSLAILRHGLEPANVRIEHMRVKLTDVPAGAAVHLRIREPAFGLVVETIPPGAPVELKFSLAGCVLRNRGTATLSRVTLRPQLPISWTWFVVSAVTLLGAVAAMVVTKWAAARRKARVAPSVPPKDSGFEGATDRE